MEQPVYLLTNGRWAYFNFILGSKKKDNYFFLQIFGSFHQVSVHIFDTSGLDLFKEVRNEFYRFDNSHI